MGSIAQYFAVAFYVLQRSFRPEMVGREAVGVGVGVIGTLEPFQIHRLADMIGDAPAISPRTGVRMEWDERPKDCHCHCHFTVGVGDACCVGVGDSIGIALVLVLGSSRSFEIG